MILFRRLLLASMTACAAVAAPPASPAKAREKPPCCRLEQAAGPHTDRSLYQLESAWVSDVERKVKLGVLHGRVQIMALFFTSCEFACPITVNDMKAIQAALPKELQDRVEFLLVSFDSERDTPKALRAFREKMHLDTQHWTLLRGNPDDVRELAALLGINYNRDARGQFAHSNLLTVLNEQGEIMHQQPGLNHNPAETVARLIRHFQKPAPAGALTK